MPRCVTVGLDGPPECRAAAERAAREAQVRGSPVRLVHVREPVSEPLAPAQVLEASREASLVVVGRRVRQTALCPHIGHVTHAVLHHADAPVAVVAHG